MTYENIESRIQVLLKKFVEPSSGEGLRLRTIGIGCNIKVKSEAELEAQLQEVLKDLKITEVDGTFIAPVRQSAGVCGIRVVREKTK